MRHSSRAAGSFRIDLHVHTGRYSQCAELVDPFLIAERAARAGLHGVVLTDHDVFWQDEEIDVLRRHCGDVALFRGIEVSARGCHLLVIGIEEAGHLYRGASVDEVVAEARRQNGAVVLAHPFRESDLDGLRVDLVDAVEVASTSFSRDESRRSGALAEALGKPAVAGSDAHALAVVGWSWTELPLMPRDEGELAAAIRAGLGQPVAPRAFPGESGGGLR